MAWLKLCVPVIVALLLLTACGGGGGGSFSSTLDTSAGGAAQTGTEGNTSPETLAGNERFTLSMPGTEAPEPTDVAAAFEQSARNAQTNRGTSALESTVPRITIVAEPDGTQIPDIDHAYAFDDGGSGDPVWLETQTNVASGGSVDEYNIRGTVYDCELVDNGYASIGLITYFAYDYAINLCENAPNSTYLFNENLYLLIYLDGTDYYARVADYNGYTSPAYGPLPVNASGHAAFDFQITLAPLSNMPVSQWSTPTVAPYTDHDCGDATLFVWNTGSGWLAGGELSSILLTDYGSDNWGWRTAFGPELYSLDLTAPVAGTPGEDGAALIGQVYALNNGSYASLDWEGELYSGSPWEDNRDWWYAEGSNNHNDCSSNLLGPSMPAVAWTYTPNVSGLNYCESEPCTDEYGNVYYGHREAFEGVSPYGVSLPGFPYFDSTPGVRSDYQYAGPTVSALFNPYTNAGWVYAGLLDIPGAIDGCYAEAISPSGNQAWEFLSPHIEACTGISEANGRVYWVDHHSSNLMFTLDAYTGNQINVHTFSYEPSPHSPAVADDGTVYVFSQNLLNALNSDGSLKYTWHPPETGPDAYVSIAPDGVIFLCGLDSGVYSVVDTGTGLYLNDSSVPGHSGIPGGMFNINTYAPRMFTAFHETPSGYNIYTAAPSPTHGVAMYDNDGHFQWEKGWSITEEVSCNPVVDDEGTIYVGTDHGNIRAFGPTGVDRWSSFNVGRPVSGMALGREDGDTDGRHSLYATLEDGRLVCINNANITLRLDFTSLENCLFDVYNVTNGSYLATNLDTDIPHNFLGVAVGLEFYVEFKTDPTHPTDRLVWPSNPSMGDTVTVTSSGLSCDGDLPTYFTTSTSLSGWELNLIPYAYTRIMCDFEDLSHASYNLYARETGETVFNNIGGPYDTTGSYAVPVIPYDLDTFVMRHNTEYYTPFSPQSYPVAGSDPSHNGNAEVIYPSTFSDGYIHLYGLYGANQMKEGDQPGNDNDYTDFVGCGMNGAFPDIDSHDMPVLYLEPDAYTRMEVTPGAGLAGDYGFWDVPNATWIIPPVSGFDPTAVVPNTMVLTRGTTFRASDGVNNSGVVSVIAGQLLNGAGPYPPTYPPDDLTWHSVSLSLGGADLYLDVLPLRIWDDPDADNPGEGITITPTPTGWDVDISFVLQYGENSTVIPCSVGVDTDWDGTWDSAPFGRTHILTGNPYYSPGVYTSTISIDSSVQPTGSYTFALIAKNSVGGEYTYVYDAAHGATPVVLASSTPSPHPWSMFGYDAKHTHQSPYVGPQTDTLDWTYSASSSIFSSPAVADDGTVYFGCIDNNVYAVNPDSTLKWTYATGGMIYTSPAIANDGTVYISSGDNNLYALNPDSTLKWTYTVSGHMCSSPTIGSDGTIYIGSDNGILYAINPDGSLKWQYTIGLTINTSPAIADDGTVYFGCGSSLWALDSNGTLKWTYTTGNTVYASAPAIADDGTVYIGSSDNSLHAVNPDGTLKWTYATGGYIYSSPAIADDGTVYVGSNDSNLYAINTDGTLQWTYALAGSAHYASPTIGADGTVYMGGWCPEICAINPDGTHKWSYAVGAGEWMDSAPAIGADGTLYISCYNSNLYAFKDTGGANPHQWPMFGYNAQHTRQCPYIGPQTNHQAWSIDLGTGGTIASPAIAADGSIYVGSNSNQFYALNPDGTSQWTFTAGDIFYYSSPAIATDGTIIVGNRDNNIYAINPDGSLRWSYTTGGDVFSTPVITDDGTIYIGSYDDNLYALNLDGTLIWTFTSNGDIFSSPAVALDGTIYFGTGNGANRLYAVNPDGTLKWFYAVGGGVFSSPAIASDGSIYFGVYTPDHRLVALNPDGTLKWSYTTGGNVFSSPAIASDGSIYFESYDGNLYALDSLGALRWNISIGGFTSSPSVGIDGTIYVGGFSGSLYGINSDGTVLWTTNLGASIYSSPAIGTDGSLYIGCNNSRIYAFHD